MNAQPDSVKFPELIIGIAGPIGINIDAITAEIRSALKALNYRAVPIKVTAAMKNYQANGVVKNGTDYFSEMSYKMDYANALCDQMQMPEALMCIAIQAIRKFRERYYRSMRGAERHSESDPSEVLIPRTAFIIRQLKRPEEVKIMREVYGKHFVLISGYGSPEDRKKQIFDSIKSSMKVNTEEADINHLADRLMARDLDESKDVTSQHLRDTYHLADVFVNGIEQKGMREGLARFFEAFFGRADVGPEKDEYGMYAAKAASFRSCDLSRQVGAAIFSDEGELIVQGCNEVPKAFGGTYWDGEEPDFRDVKIGYDPNEVNKREAIRGLLEALGDKELLSERATCIQSSSELVSILLGQSNQNTDLDFFGALKGTGVDAITEYGRVVHAEMCALCDAARLGRSVKDGTLYCTTFPCHNCTKHLLAAGVRKVVFIEPYPKSRAKDLHHNEIELEKDSATKVSFMPFLGISPFRYRDIFQKGNRKRDGQAKSWYQDVPRPMVESSRPTYFEAERAQLIRLGGSFQAALF